MKIVFIVIQIYVSPIHCSKCLIDHIRASLMHKFKLLTITITASIATLIHVFNDVFLLKVSESIINFVSILNYNFIFCFLILLNV
jgi:hypothetical protein